MILLPIEPRVAYLERASDAANTEARAMFVEARAQLLLADLNQLDRFVNLKPGSSAAVSLAAMVEGWRRRVTLCRQRCAL